MQYVVSESDKKFADDLGLGNFSGSLGNDYTTTVQEQIADLLGNGVLEGKSGLDEAKLFDDLPASITGNSGRLGAASTPGPSAFHRGYTPAQAAHGRNLLHRALEPPPGP